MSPLLSSFQGISIRLQCEVNGKHNSPHIHVRYGGTDLSIDFEGEVLAGRIDDFPKGKLKLVLAWIELHKEELQSNWDNYNLDGQWTKIDPLR